jgi:GNAT superfamily N-acetyltransferase
MHGTAANDLQPVLLSFGDVDELFALYELARSVTPYGFLAIRSKDHFREIFREPENVIGTGLRDNGRLVGYSICHRVATNPYPESALLSVIQPKRDILFQGDGWVVHPDYQGRRLGRRLFELRSQQMNERQVDHMLGLAAIDNVSSISSALHAGALLVGFARDETALNYIVYAGRLCKRLIPNVPPIMISHSDHNEQNRLFGQRHAICDVGRPSRFALGASRDDAEFQFYFLPVK